MALQDDVTNGMKVLHLLAPEADGLGVSQVATSLGLNKAIAHRLLAALVAAGYVAQNPKTSAYSATHRLGALGLLQLSASGIDTWAQRELDALATTSEELVRLAVASSDSLQWIAKAQGSNSSLRLDPVMGRDAVPHATASGKAWLATLTPDEVQRVIDQHHLTPQTPRTVVDPEALAAELAAVRHRGYATTYEEMDPGISAVAAPIFGAGHDRPATGTISIAGPSVRMTRARLADLAPAVIAAADEIATTWPSYTYLTAESALSA